MSTTASLLGSPARSPSVAPWSAGPPDPCASGGVGPGAAVAVVSVGSTRIGAVSLLFPPGVVVLAPAVAALRPPASPGLAKTDDAMRCMPRAASVDAKRCDCPRAGATGAFLGSPAAVKGDAAWTLPSRASAGVAADPPAGRGAATPAALAGPAKIGTPAGGMGSRASAGAAADPPAGRKAPVPAAPARLANIGMPGARRARPQG